MNNKPNVITSIIGILLSSYVFLAVRSFPKPPTTVIGPSFFPMVLALALFGFSTLLLITALLKKDQDDYEKINIKSPEFIRSLLSLVLSILYVLIMQVIGFITATIIYLLCLMFLLNNREYVKMVTVSLAVSIIVYILFKSVLNITLPAGFFI